jgi:hypothetical protein
MGAKVRNYCGDAKKGGEPWWFSEDWEFGGGTGVASRPRGCLNCDLIDLYDG